VPEFKTIADFRRDNAAAIRATCRQFVVLRRDLGLLAGSEVAVDGSKFKAVNSYEGFVRKRRTVVLLRRIVFVVLSRALLLSAERPVR
jgi:transposase